MTSSNPTILPIGQLQPNPLQPRGKIKKEDLGELVQSIKAYGILEPIVVAQTPAGYQIIAGERRWRAAREAGLEEVPVNIKVTTPRGMLEMAIIENVQRVDLTALERAQAFQQLIRDFRFSISQVAEKLGKSISYVSNSLKLLELPDAITDGLAGGQITEGHARAIAGIGNERSMIECYKIILKESASVRRAEELARRFKENLGQVTKTAGGRTKYTTPNLDTWQKSVQSLFGKKSHIKLARSARQTKVTFVFKGTPEETEDELKKMMDMMKS
jgi:ParB family transcriptional regulator, chromosome partitioning protein